MLTPLELFFDHSLFGKSPGGSTNRKSQNADFAQTSPYLWILLGHFRITVSLFLKASLGAHPFIWTWDFIHMQIKLISYESLCTRPRFEREALGNSEMGLLKINLTFSCISKYFLLRHEFYRKIENIVPTFKQLSPLQTNDELMTSTNHYVNIQLAKFISSCLDLRNILLSNQTDVTWLLYHSLIICSR